MTTPDDPTNLPVPISAALSGIPAALIPASIKALDRLIGAAVDIPVAWLEQQKVKIVSQTEAFRAIDGAIAKTAAEKAGDSEQYADRALTNLVRKSYRQLENKEAVSAAMLEDLRDSCSQAGDNGNAAPTAEVPSIDDDWLNVFERYAEDASTERMQRLWGRVLAGEVRAPGKYSMRTLRFLSEFSQADGLEFSLLCMSSLGDLVPKSLVKGGTDDIRKLIYMEAAGLIQGASGLGLISTMTFDDTGRAYIVEQSIAIMFVGHPGTKINFEIFALTPLGQELVTLLPGRDARAAARAVAMTVRRPEIKSAYLMHVKPDGSATAMEVLWDEQAQVSPVVSN